LPNALFRLSDRFSIGNEHLCLSSVVFDAFFVVEVITEVLLQPVSV
jgi:hypothetical protein